MIKISTHPA